MSPLDLVPPLPGPRRVAADGLLTFRSPVGRIEVRSRDGAVVAVAVERDGRLPGDQEDERPDDLLRATQRQISDWFAGVRREFDLPLRPEGTPFQLGVWAALRAVPWGRTTTYGALGAAVGRPQAGRAVGGAVASNPLPLLVPCHRVLGRTGGLTGYTVGAGVRTKAWLLGHEGVPYRLGPLALDQVTGPSDHHPWGPEHAARRPGQESRGSVPEERPRD